MSTNQPQQSDKEHDNTASHIVVGSGGHETVFRRAVERLQFIVRRIFGMARYRLIAIGAIFCILIMAGAWLAFIKLPNHNPPPNAAGSASKSGNNKSEVDSSGDAKQDQPPASEPKPDTPTASSPNPAGSAGTTGGSGSTGGGSGASSGWPGASNTGVPAGTVLGAYSGCSGGEVVITTANTVIDSKQVNCNVIIRATGIVIKKSKINGTINIDEDLPGSASITDSEVTLGVGTKNLTILRANIHGSPTNGGTTLYCYTNCDVRDSWIHSPIIPAGAPDAHLGAFLANDNGPDGSTTNVTLVHNFIHCDTPPTPEDGGCSGDVNLFGDFGPITHVTVDGNLLGASTGISYCFYGGDSPSKPYPNADYVVFKNNVFQKGTSGHCGAYGPVAGFDTGGTGNAWSNNKYDDGATVNPEN